MFATYHEPGRAAWDRRPPQEGHEVAKADVDHDGHVDVVHVVLADMRISRHQLWVLDEREEGAKQNCQQHSHGRAEAPPHVPGWAAVAAQEGLVHGRGHGSGLADRRGLQTYRGAHGVGFANA